MDTYINPNLSERPMQSSPASIGNKMPLLWIGAGASIFLFFFGILFYSQSSSSKKTEQEAPTMMPAEAIPQDSSTNGNSDIFPTVTANAPADIQSQSPQTFTLSVGDAIMINKTRFTKPIDASGEHEDIQLTFLVPIHNWTVAVFDGIGVGETARIRVDNEATHFRKFDIRPLMETKSGLLLFYPEGDTITRDTVGKPPGAVFEIPIKLEF